MEGKIISYQQKLCWYLDDYTKVLVVATDHVNNTQLSSIRYALRGRPVILMGNNHTMKPCVMMHSDKPGNEAYIKLIPHIVGNVGFIFTNDDWKEVIDEVSKYERMILVARVDVVVPPCDTGVHQSHVSLVGSSEAALLAKLGIRPFSYDLVLRTVYENDSVFSLEELEDPSKFDVATSGGDVAPAEEKKEEPAKESFSE
ncbi:hypothetical protein L6452_05353 [Arctium lappa]|uniref:Uncharacterized protein n=1 Tax=Arctium lappa TaxID=4217 RepID=A0ACB9EGH5_ARCLA|nr:hypothetical protein L6452_05353 [Arctium lappa]